MTLPTLLRSNCASLQSTQTTGCAGRAHAHAHAQQDMWMCFDIQYIDFSRASDDSTDRFEWHNGTKSLYNVKFNSLPVRRQGNGSKVKKRKKENTQDDSTL
ncbi:hypothetical protein E2C01_039396 [Portunus trituberculatus]|uniref:Uncharacterized protein n=1 Tax=Portunus trituberculatus TaxID=210409 RepID=A0A5B7FDJ0_PORTR|nr:hypothetical protein [Portunus trituberculatus]